MKLLKLLGLGSIFALLVCAMSLHASLVRHAMKSAELEVVLVEDEIGNGKGYRGRLVLLFNAV